MLNNLFVNRHIQIDSGVHEFLKLELAGYQFIRFTSLLVLDHAIRIGSSVLRVC